MAWLQDAFFVPSERRGKKTRVRRKNAKSTNMLFQEWEFVPTTVNNLCSLEITNTNLKMPSWS